MVRRNSKGKGFDMKKIIILTAIFLHSLTLSAFSKNELYEKIDLFGEVLEIIKKGL